MLILSRVCAEFHDRTGRTIFKILPSMLLSFLDAPEEIQSDPLFTLLQRDGSLEAVRSVAQRQALEADPLAGIDAEGKASRAAADSGDNADSPADAAFLFPAASAASDDVLPADAAQDNPANAVSSGKAASGSARRNSGRSSGKKAADA